MIKTVRQSVAKGIGLLGILLIGILATTVPSTAHHRTTAPLPSSRHATQATHPQVFGFETYSGRMTNSTLRTRARELGASWIRLNTASWRDLQLAEDDPVAEWNWETMETFEQEVVAAQEEGLTPIAIIDDFPDWAVIPYFNPYTSQHETAPCAALKTAYFDDYATFASEMVKRYSVPPYNVKHWELGNEPDIDPRLIGKELQNLFGCWGDIEDSYYGGMHYGEMLKVVVPAIREADPEAKVLNGGILLDRANTQIVGRGKPERFMAGVFNAGAADYLDYVAFHSYPWYEEGKDTDLTDYRWSKLGGMTLGKAKFLRNIMDEYDVDKPLMLDEAALLFWGGSATEDFLQTQANHVVRVLVRSISADIKSHSWYTLHESGWNSSGLLGGNYGARPAYVAYQEMIKQLSPFEHEGVTAVSEYGSTVEAYRFSGDSQNLDVVWSRSTANVAVTLFKSEFQKAYSRDGDILTPTITTDLLVSLPVGNEPIYLYRTPPSENAPQITEISSSPPETTNEVVRTVIINGVNFDNDTRVLLMHPTTMVTTALGGVNVKSATQVTAEVPQYHPVATYDVLVVNSEGAGDRAVGGLKVTAAYRPEIRKILPTKMYADGTTNLHIYATDEENVRFLPNATVTIGETTIPSTQTTRLDASYLRATIAANTLEPGNHDVRVTNPDGPYNREQYALTVLAPDAVDLTADAFELWTTPLTTYVSETVGVGVVVQHQQQQTSTISSDSVTVHFYEQIDEEHISIGETQITIPTNGNATPTTEVSWPLFAVGSHQLCATIDKDNQLVEEDEENNEVCRKVTVNERRADMTPPSIVDFTINGEQDGTTADPVIRLAVEATDAAAAATGVSSSSLAPSSSPANDDEEVLWYAFEEYEYSQGARQWIPLQSSTAWVTGTSRFSTTWELVPSAGEKYLHVWVSDGSHNSSFPTAAAITYQPDPYDPLEPVVGTPSVYRLPPTLPDMQLQNKPEGYIVYLPVVQQQSGVVTSTMEMGVPTEAQPYPDILEFRSQTFSRPEPE